MDSKEFKKAIAVLVKEKGIKPYLVYDAGNFLIVYLGGEQ